MCLHQQFLKPQFPSWLLSMRGWDMLILVCIFMFVMYGLTYQQPLLPFSELTWARAEVARRHSWHLRCVTEPRWASLSPLTRHPFKTQQEQPVWEALTHCWRSSNYWSDRLFLGSSRGRSRRQHCWPLDQRSQSHVSDMNSGFQVFWRLGQEAVNSPITTTVCM